MLEATFSQLFSLTYVVGDVKNSRLWSVSEFAHNEFCSYSASLCALFKFLVHCAASWSVCLY